MRRVDATISPVGSRNSFWIRVLAARWAEADVSFCCRYGVMSVAERGSYTRGAAELAEIHRVLV